MRRPAIFLLILLLCAMFTNAESAFATTGVYPDSPVQHSPVNYAGGTTVYFSFNSYNSAYYTGFIGYPVNYYLEVYESGTLVYGGYTGGSTNFPVSIFQDVGSSYTWRVQAEYDFYDDYDGSYAGNDYSNWSTYFGFTNGPSGPPAAPPLISPSNGGNVGGNSVNFSWTPVVRADDYRLRVVSAVSGAVFFDEWLGGDYSGINLSGFEDLGESFTWQVQGKNNVYTGSISGSRSFVNGPSGPPTTPIQTNPINGANAGGGTVPFRWNPVARADNYRLRVVSAVSGALFFDEWLGDYAYGVDLSGFEDLGEGYTWQVQAKNVSYYSSVSASQSFVNGPSGPPPTPTPSSPIGGVIAGGGTVSFSWSPVARADNYRLRVVSAVSGAVFFDGWLGDYAYGVDLSGFEDLGEGYTWQVQAKNITYTSALSSSQAFVNGPSGPPPIPTQTSPINGANAGGNTVSFRWTPVVRADNYRLRVVSTVSGSVFFDGWLGDYSYGVDLSGFDDLGESYTWQVQAKNNTYTGTISASQPFVNGPSGPPPIPVQYSPINGANAGGSTVSFQWSPVARADNYRLRVVSMITGVVFFDGWLGDYAYGVDLSGFEDLGESYTWQVQAKNIAYTGTISGNQSFVNGPSGPPVAPSLSSPIGGSVAGGDTVSFRWSPVFRADNYRLRIVSASGAVFFDAWLGDYGYGADISGFADLGESITWQVQAKNNTYTGPISGLQTFLNGPSGPPPTPVQLSPIDGNAADGAAVTFNWTAVERADNYRLLITSASGITAYDQWIGDISGISINGFDELNEIYFWQVQAKNRVYTSALSAIESFVNGPTTIPNTPSLITPSDGANAPGSQVTLTWSDTTKATYYHLQVATDSSFANLLHDQQLGSDTSVIILVDDGQTYYWRVAAGNMLGQSPFSGSRSFINGPSAPDAPPLLSAPQDGGNAKGTTITFQWLPVDRADDYLLEISLDSNFGSSVFSEWIGNVTELALGGFSNTGGQYYWHVAARNAQGTTAFQTSWSFVNGPDNVVLPDAPVLIVPINGSNIAGSNISFSWESVANVDYYTIQVARDVYFANIVQELDVSGTGTSINIFSNDGSEYYWRVASVKGVEMGAFSPIFNFTNGALNGAIHGEAGFPTICDAKTMWWQQSGSVTNIATGILAHDQDLFTVKGSTLDASISLFYNSLPAYSGSLGSGWSHSYDISLTENSDGSILFREGNGNRSFYSKSGNSYIPQTGNFSTLARNVDNSFVVTFRDGRKYNFAQTGKITSIVDRFANTISFNYDTHGDLHTITDPSQRTITIGYDLTTTPHRITTITNPNQKIYDFVYQGNDLQKVINPIADPTVSTERGFWEYRYDVQGQGFMQSKRDPNGNLTQYKYYADHRMKSATDPDGVVDPNGHTRTLIYPTNIDNIKTTTFVEKDGGQWLRTYDTQSGIMKSMSDPNGKITSYSYYSNGFLKSKTEPRDGITRLTTFYSYDGYGNLISQTEPVDLSVYSAPYNNAETIPDPSVLANFTPAVKPALSYSYDNANFDRVTSVSDLRVAPNITTSFAYTVENGGEVVTATANPGNYITVVKKNSDGTIKETIDANLKHTSYSYYSDNSANRAAGIVGLLQSVTGVNGVTTAIISYDTNGNSLNILTKDTTGVVKLTSAQKLDALNRLQKLTKTTASLPAIITQYGYDNIGNLSSLIDAELRETKYENNYVGQVTKITDAKLNDTLLVYSGTGCGSCGGVGVNKLIEVRDANQAKKPAQAGTDYRYDQLGRLDYETDPLGKKNHYTYYDNGLVKEKYDASASMPGTLLTTFLYNAHGQITDNNYADGTYEHYTYYPNGKLWTATNQNISYTYTYYDDGRLHTVVDATNNRTISYDQYDGLGQRKQVTILKGAGADERVIFYEYDYANRPWHITSNAGLFTFTYDTLGRRDILSYPNGTEKNWDFDDLGRLSSLTHNVKNGPTIAVFNYSDFDKVGNRKSVAGDKSEGYFYDELYRLLNVTSNNPESFIFDDVGNRKSGPIADDNGYQHNSANQMIQGRELQYGYDNAGNQNIRTLPSVIDKTWLQTWDYANRLVKIEKIDGVDNRTVLFKYDPLGRRISKQVTTIFDGLTEIQSWSYVYDGYNIATEFYTDANNITTKTYYSQGLGVDEHLAFERGGQFYFYHSDGLESTVAISDSNHNIVQSYEYDSYGMAQPSTPFVNNLTFVGKEWDKETGFYKMGARYYDPIDGRFISKDPISIAGGINVYDYTSGNPINYSDPSGLLTGVEETAVITGTVVVVGAVISSPPVQNALKNTANQIDALSQKMSAEIERLKQKTSGPNSVQYSLRAAACGNYSDVRGGTSYLNQGDVWKYGETTNPGGRYSQDWLRTNKLLFIPESTGSQTEMKVAEKIKIYGYFFLNGSLPPGNKIFR